MRRATRFAALLLAAACLAATALPGGGAPVRANGVPQLVKLTYLDGVSNFGPTDAEGVLEFSFAEAYAKVDVKALPPQDGYTFDGWLSALDGAAFHVGELALTPTGIGQFEGTLANLERYDYNTFIVAARPAGSEIPAAIPADRSIAGRFTVLDDSGATSGADIRPQQLPDTGEAPRSPLAANAGRLLYVAAVMGVATAATVTIRRIQRRRSA